MDVAVLVFGNGHSRIATTTDITPALRKWRQRYGMFAPVAAFATQGDWPRDDIGLHTVGWAAERFASAPVDRHLQKAVFRHIRALGADSVPLLLEWHRAVVVAKEVGVRALPK